MSLSVVVALVLTPALCATLLKPGHGLTRTGPFGLFNRGYEASARLEIIADTYLSLSRPAEVAAP